MPSVPARDALKDALTEALNRAEFDRLWPEQVAETARSGGRCALLVLDIDHFKSINDAFGHRHGDNLLVDLVQRVRDTTRASDLLFRYGGDEFTLVLPDTGLREAMDLAQRVLDAVAARPFGEAGIRVSLSIGVAALPADGLDARALFDAADARAYAAKRAGRARVVAHSPAVAGPAELATLSRRVERDEVMAQAHDFLAALATQPCGVLVLAGPAGSGRSTALADVAVWGGHRGCRVVEVRASARLKTRPCAALEHALPGFHAGGSDELAALANALAATSGAGAGAGTGASTTPVLLCVDDLPQLDWHSLYLLRQLLAQPGPLQLGLVVVTDDAEPLPAGLTCALQMSVRLQPLSRDGLRAWLRMRLQWNPPDELVDGVLAHSGGLPLHVERLLSHLMRQGSLRPASPGWQLHDLAAALAADPARRWAPPPRLGNLPVALSSFVGREAALDAVTRLVQLQRLVTLTGAGGTGKTRLALRAAAELQGHVRHGVWLVDLARVSDPERVPDAVAAALGVRKTRGRPLADSLSSWLSRRDLLLVLDNCEHLLGAVAPLAHTLLQAAASLRVLATSREPLAVAGEHVWRVPSLQLPEPGDAADPAQLLRSESVRLFLDRAAQARPDFRLTPDTAPAVATLCRRLDGVALALELAAARLRLLDVHQIAQRLDDRFALLVGGHRTAVPRQQTLRATLDWSHALLLPAEQVLLRRLAVFAGGCTLEAAESVCAGGEPPHHLDRQSVLPLLAGLVDKSLVQVQAPAAKAGAAPEPRYTMLETVRHYAAEHLHAAGERAALQQAHAQWVLGLAERAEPGVSGVAGHEQSRWLDRLDAELDNLRVALSWAREHDTATMLRLASAQWRFCDLRGHLVEGLDALLQALQAVQASAEGATRPPTARGWARAAYMARNLGDFAQAERLADQALQAAAQGLPDGAAEAMALFIKGAAALEFNRPDEGRRHLERALLLFRAAGDDGLAGTTLVFLGFEAELRNDTAAARAWMRQGLEATRRSGDHRRICHALVRLGFVAIAAGDAAEAVQHFEQALALGRAVGDTAYIANGLFLLGRAALFNDDPDRARGLLGQVLSPRDGAVASENAWALLELAKVHWAQDDVAGFEQHLLQARSLAQAAGLHEVHATAQALLAHVARARGDRAEALALLHDAQQRFSSGRREGLCLCLEAAAQLALDEGDAERAAHLAGAREALRERHFLLDHYPFMQRRRQALADQLRQQLGEHALHLAWLRGRRLDADAAWALVAR